ncbi:MAG: YegP family protein [archaeon]
MAPKFEIYADRAGKCRWRLKAANGEPIASGEAYESEASCKNGIASVKKNAPIAEIVTVDE